MKAKIRALFVISFAALSGIVVAQNARISGLVTDAATGEPLPGANVILEGTAIGSATTLSGEYSILNVPPGNYRLKVVYIGYQDKSIEIEAGPDENLVQNISLQYQVIEGDVIVVTAQAEGQMSAINQQRSANSIKNVVSSSQIQELPDANAAESIRRLPGVSITRVGGEGNQVVIRGMAPKYNVITIDGMRMASSNKDDRGADLSMISSTMLEGIEVSKTITADQDADMLGGSVNFKIREAKGGQEGIGFHIMAQGGYTGLSNANNKFNNYQIAPSFEGRLFDEKLGVFVQANLERRNLSSNEFGATYSNKSNDLVNYITQSISLRDIPRDRRRLNGALVLDYKLEDGIIRFRNFLSSGKTITQNRSEVFNINANQHIYSFDYANSTLNMLSNTLNFEKKLGFIHADFNVSHNYSESDNPDDWTVTFYQTPAGINQFANKSNLDPQTVVRAAFHDSTKTKLNTLMTSNSFSQERSWTWSLDLDFPWNLSKNVSSVIKFGGKYRTQKRSFKTEAFTTNATLVSPSARGATQLIIDHFGIPTNDPTSIPLAFFVDPDFDYGTFLEGDYTMYNPINYGLLQSLVRFAQDNTDEFAKAGAKEAFARNNYLSNTNNYGGDEVMSAFYAMATINVGQKLTIIPGVRYQNLETTYSGTRGQQTPFSYNFYDHSTDTTVTVSHPFLLPNLNIQYKPFTWMDVRVSWSNTISYPDYRAIIPRIDVTTGAALAWNNYKLKPSESTNYDVYFTFSENKIGFFTIGGFLKQIDNLIYPWRFSKAGLDAKPYYLTNKNPATQLNYNISTFINNPFTINNWGIELDWQTHFWYLPNPFKGLVLNANYTFVKSEAEYPFVYSGATSATNIDTSFTDRLLLQPNHIVNISLGYDYRDFSIRLSVLYQDDVFTGVSQWPQLRSSTAAYERWDVSFSQKLPWYGVQLYGNVSNLNNAKDKSVLQKYPQIPNTVEVYGLTGEIGFRWRM